MASIQERSKTRPETPDESAHRKEPAVPISPPIEPMLAKLVEKAGGEAPFPLVVGDATALPFSDDRFGGAVVRHVLHLVPAWRQVVAELVRVVVPETSAE